VAEALAGVAGQDHDGRLRGMARKRVPVA